MSSFFIFLELELVEVADFFISGVLRAWWGVAWKDGKSESFGRRERVEVVPAGAIAGVDAALFFRI